MVGWSGRSFFALAAQIVRQNECHQECPDENARGDAQQHGCPTAHENERFGCQVIGSSLTLDEGHIALRHNK